MKLYLVLGLLALPSIKRESVTVYKQQLHCSHLLRTEVLHIIEQPDSSVNTTLSDYNHGVTELCVVKHYRYRVLESQNTKDIACSFEAALRASSHQPFLLSLFVHAPDLSRAQQTIKTVLVQYGEMSLPLASEPN